MKGKLVQGGLHIHKYLYCFILCFKTHRFKQAYSQNILYFLYFFPNMLRIQGGEHCKQQNISAPPNADKYDSIIMENNMTQ